MTKLLQTLHTQKHAQTSINSHWHKYTTNNNYAHPHQHSK